MSILPLPLVWLHYSLVILTSIDTDKDIDKDTDFFWFPEYFKSRKKYSAS